MEENKVYKAERKSVTWGSVALFLFGAYWLVKSIVVVVQSGDYDSINFMWVFKEVFLLYYCFLALHIAPQKVEFLKDELVRITFLFGNSITIKQEIFKISRLNNVKKGWAGWLNAKGRMIFFTSDAFPELENYLTK